MEDRTTYIGHIRQFKLYYSDWSLYKAHLDNYFIANNITNSARKRAILLAMLDEEAYKLMLFLCQPLLPEDQDFEALIVTFDQHLVPSKSMFVERYKFYKAKKPRGESVDDWSMRVRNLAATCQFGQYLDACLRDKFIFGLGEEHLSDFLGNDDSLTFEEAVEIAKEKVGNSESYWYDFRGGCTNTSSSYRFHDFEKLFFADEWSFFCPYVVLDCSRHCH